MQARRKPKTTLKILVANCSVVEIRDPIRTVFDDHRCGKEVNLPLRFNLPARITENLVAGEATSCLRASCTELSNRSKDSSSTLLISDSLTPMSAP